MDKQLDFTPRQDVVADDLKALTKELGYKVSLHSVSELETMGLIGKPNGADQMVKQIVTLADGSQVEAQVSTWRGNKLVDFLKDEKGKNAYGAFILDLGIKGISKLVIPVGRTQDRDGNYRPLLASPQNLAGDKQYVCAVSKSFEAPTQRNANGFRTVSFGGILIDHTLTSKLVQIYGKSVGLTAPTTTSASDALGGMAAK